MCALKRELLRKLAARFNRAAAVPAARVLPTDATHHTRYEHLTNVAPVGRA